MAQITAYTVKHNTHNNKTATYLWKIAHFQQRGQHKNWIKRNYSTVNDFGIFT